MKYFWIFTAAFLLYFPLQAQHTFIQLGDKESAAAFAEAPQKFLSDMRAVRGFGGMWYVNGSEEKVAKFYQKGKEGENFLVFFIVVEIVNGQGKVVANTGRMEAKLVPGRKTFPGEYYFPGQSFFPKGTYEKLPAGNYALRMKAVPAQKELARMFKMGEPEVRYTFSK